MPALFLDIMNSGWGFSGQTFCISNTWWSFNVHIESLSGTVKTAVCDAACECTVMMNGCLVCWFYSVLVVHLTVAGRFTQWELSWRGKQRWRTVTHGRIPCQSSCPSEDTREP